MKRLLAFILTLALLTTALVGCGSKETKDDGEQGNEVITLTINTITGNYRDELVDYIAKTVPEKTDGRIQISVLPAGSMGDERELVESAQMDSIDMVLTADALIATVVSELGWINLPGIVSNYDEADEAFFGNGWIYDAVANVCEDNGLVKLGAFDNGFRTVGATKKIENPEDLKGVKIRCGSSNTTIFFYQYLGCLPSSISSAEILSALESGTIDATDNSVTNFVANGLQDNINMVSLLYYSYSAGSVLINQDKWNTVSEEDQKIIKQVVEEACAEQVTSNRAYSEQLLKEYSDSGKWTVYANNDAMQKAINEASLATVKEFRSTYDAEVMDKIASILNDKLA